MTPPPSLVSRRMLLRGLACGLPAALLLDSLWLEPEWLESPLFGVPGNHDLWNAELRAEVARAFEATGGRWLEDDVAEAANGDIRIVGYSGLRRHSAELAPNARNIALMHYPEWVDTLSGLRFDLVLAGHSHGGQIRIPGLGAPILPQGVGPYDLGRFETASGPLYVGAGVGWFNLRARFLCRPEIALFRL